jgi:hypothetical protein
MYAKEEEETDMQQDTQDPRGRASKRSLGVDGLPKRVQS